MQAVIVASTQDVGHPAVLSPASLEHQRDVLQASSGASGRASSQALGRDQGNLYLEELSDSSDYELLNPQTVILIMTLLETFSEKYPLKSKCYTKL